MSFQIRRHRSRQKAARLFMALVFFVGCASPVAPPAAPPVERYRVGPPDRLSVSILPEPEILREVVVRPDGMISVDLIGDVPAAGRTPEEIAGDIESRIGRFKRDASVTVSLAAALSDQITVLGEVERPSTFPLTRKTRLVDAIGMVGGPSHLAAKSRIRIVRVLEGKATVYRVNLDSIEDGDLSTNLMLQGGDIVYVPPTVFGVIGYFIAGLLFPIAQIFGAGGGRGAITVMTGGAL